MRPVVVCGLLLLAGLLAGQETEEKAKKGECTNTGKKPSEKLFAPYTVKNKSKTYEIIVK